MLTSKEQTLADAGVIKCLHALPPMRTGVRLDPRPRYIRPGAEVEWKTPVTLETRRGLAPPLPVAPWRMTAEGVDEPEPIGRRRKQVLKVLPAGDGRLLSIAEAYRRSRDEIGCTFAAFYHRISKARKKGRGDILSFIEMRGAKAFIIKEKFLWWLKNQKQEEATGRESWMTATDAHKQWPAVVKSIKWLNNKLYEDRHGLFPSFGLADCVVGRNPNGGARFDREKLAAWIATYPDLHAAALASRAAASVTKKATRIDITGQRFGRLTAISFIAYDGNKSKWLCRCDCGCEKAVSSDRLRYGLTRSCGCHNTESRRKRMEKINDITGRQYGRLTVLHRDGTSSDGNHALWRCRCDCGNEVSVKGTSLRRGDTKSCGKHTRADHDRIDLTGITVGTLTVTGLAPKAASGHVYWHCRCATCGVEKTVRGSALRQGKVPACNCPSLKTGKIVRKTFASDGTRRGRRAVPMAGRRFGRWTVLEFAGREARGKREKLVWACRCDCGTVKQIPGMSLRNGTSLSCGCSRYKSTRRSTP